MRRTVYALEYVLGILTGFVLASALYGLFFIPYVLRNWH